LLLPARAPVRTLPRRTLSDVPARQPGWPGAAASGTARATALGARGRRGRGRRRALRTGFKSRMVFGGLESPAACRSRAVVIVRLLAGGRATGRPAATPGPLMEPSEPGGFAGTDPGSRKGPTGFSEPGSAPARFEPPDHTRDS